MHTVRYETEGPVAIVTINRPAVRNAVDGPTQQALAEAFRHFDTDDALSVAVLTGAGGTFCAGADLKAIAAGSGNRAAEDGDGPMGPTRMVLSKPVIAAVEGYAVAGGPRVGDLVRPVCCRTRRRLWGVLSPLGSPADRWWNDSTVAATRPQPCSRSHLDRSRCVW